jgi:hypothetical protein
MSGRGWAKKMWRVLVIALWSLRQILLTAWGLARGPVIFALQVVAALIVLFEEWGWKPLSAALAWFAKFAPVAAIERWIATLGPYPSLLVFALPTTLLLPLKLVAMWLLAQGQVATATGLFIGAKIASTALIARVFTLTKPALMQITWFARTYNWFVPWKDAFFTTIRASTVWRYGRMIKNVVRHEVKQAWKRWRPLVEPRLRGAVGSARAIGTRLYEGLFGSRGGS